MGSMRDSIDADVGEKKKRRKKELDDNNVHLCHECKKVKTRDRVCAICKIKLSELGILEEE
jgi:ribosomal protein L32